jgi:hypothetical protein
MHRRIGSFRSSSLFRFLQSLPFFLVFAVAAFPARAVAQQKQEEMPFIEPAEHSRMVKARVLPPHPNLTGAWQTLANEMPINPVHVALMHNGKVLVISGSGNDPDNHVLEAGVWDPPTQTVRTFRITWDMFCNGMVILPDGRPFVLGGTKKYDNFLGEPLTAAFNPATESFAATAGMGSGRWYPTATELGDGSVMVISGLNDTTGSVNTSIQRYQPATNTFTSAGTSFPGVPLYPRMNLLPSGKVFESGANFNSMMYDPAATTWSAVANTIFGKNRDYGTSVLLPLTPANGFKPRVIIAGGGPGGTNVTATTEIIDLSAATPAWTAGPNMVHPRIQMNGTILPNGRVLMSGGSATDEDPSTGTLEAELFDPATGTFSSAGSMEFARVYHSNTLLLPDATVLAVGGNPQRTVYEPHIEIYSPPYLFTSSGGPAVRPVIASVPPELHYGQTFPVKTPDAASVKEVVLIRPGAVTHAFDMDQRLVGMTFTTAPGGLSVKAPVNGNLAPPGYYMLFIVNSAGVPSVASFVHLGSGTGHDGDGGHGDHGDHGDGHRGKKKPV